MAAIRSPYFQQSMFFILKALAAIWTRWLVKDLCVCHTYREALISASAKLLRKVDGGRLTPIDAANRAVNARNLILSQIREKTSLGGLLLALYIKPTCRSREYYMNKNASKNYSVGYNELTDDLQQIMVGLKYQEFTRSLISSLLGSNP